MGEGDYRGRGFFIFFFSFREGSIVFRLRALVGGCRVGGGCVVLRRCVGARVGVVGFLLRFLGEKVGGVVVCCRCFLAGARVVIVGLLRRFVEGFRVGGVGRSARTFPLAAVPFCVVALRSSARTSDGGHLSQGFGGESAVLAVEEEEPEVFHHAADEGGVFVQFVAQRVVVEFGRALGTVAQMREHHHIEAKTRGAHLATQLSALADAVGVGFEGEIGTE